MINSGDLKTLFTDGIISNLWVVDDGADGVGGAAGMKKDGIEATVAIIPTYKTILGISFGAGAKKGLISWPSAPPSGLASVMTAVAATRPLFVNQRSL